MATLAAMSEHDQEQEHEDEHFAGQVVERDDEPRDAEREARRLVALAQVRQYGDPVLRMRAEPVEAFDEELRRTATRMLALMHDADGIGLAATQVGILRRFFVFRDEDEDRVIVNPQIAATSGETEVDEEGCLSLGPVRVPVERSLAVTLEGTDAGGAPLRLELEGLPARVAQHELDHLDGVLILQRTDAESRREALKLLRPRLALA
jgi:peptide deformylase